MPTMHKFLETFQMWSSVKYSERSQDMLNAFILKSTRMQEQNKN